MSFSSSSNATNFCDSCDIRYENRFCRCGLRCLVKITESNEKNNKGKLYFTCPNGTCKFWDWCKPISTINQSSHQNLDDAVSDLKFQYNAISCQLRVIEAKQGAMKKLLMTLMFCIIPGVILMLKLA